MVWPIKYTMLLCHTLESGQGKNGNFDVYANYLKQGCQSDDPQEVFLCVCLSML